MTLRRITAITALAATPLLAAACGHHHAHPHASAAASSAKAAAYQDVTSPTVLAAEKKLAPKFQTCLANEGAHVRIVGAGTTKIQVVPQDIKLHFIGHAVRHPFLTLENTAQCAGLTRAQVKAMGPKIAQIVAANGMGHGSLSLDVRQTINAAAVQVSGS